MDSVPQIKMTEIEIVKNLLLGHSCNDCYHLSNCEDHLNKRFCDQWQKMIIYEQFNRNGEVNFVSDERSYKKNKIS